MWPFQSKVKRAPQINQQAKSSAAAERANANTLLFAGAEVKSISEMLGRSESDTITALVRDYKKQLRAGNKVSPTEYLKKVGEAAYGAVGDEITTVNDQIPNSQLRAFETFGQDQSDMQSSMVGARAARGKGVRDDNSINVKRWDRGVPINETFSVDPNKPTPAGLIDDFKMRDFGLYNPTTAPTVPTSTAGDKLIAQQLINRENARVTPAMKAAAEEDRQLSALIKQIRQPISSVETAGSQAPRTGSVNDYIAQAWKYRQMGEPSGGYITSAAGAQNVARIPTLSNLGTAKKGVENQATTRLNIDTRSMPVAIPRSIENPTYVDPLQGTPVGQSYYPAYEANTPNLLQALNAPTTISPSTADWFITDQMDLLKEQGRIGQLPQVNISGETTEFARRLQSLIKELGSDVQLNPNIRSASELQSSVDFVDRLNKKVEKQTEADSRMGITRSGSPKPKKFYAKDESGKEVYVDDPGVQELLNVLRYDKRGTQNLKQALTLLEQAKASSSGSSPIKDEYFNRTRTMVPNLPQPFPSTTTERAINYNAPELSSFGQPELTGTVSRGRTVQGGRRGIEGSSLTAEGKPIRSQVSAALDTLESPDARSWAIGFAAQTPSGGRGQEAPLGRRTRSGANPVEPWGIRSQQEEYFRKRQLPKKGKPAWVPTEEDRRENTAKIRKMQEDAVGIERDTIKAEQERRERQAKLAPYRVNLGGMS